MIFHFLRKGFDLERHLTTGPKVKKILLTQIGMLLTLEVKPTIHQPTLSPLQFKDRLFNPTDLKHSFCSFYKTYEKYMKLFCGKLSIMILCNGGLVTQHSCQRATTNWLYSNSLSFGITEPSQSCSCGYLSLRSLHGVRKVVTLDLLTKVYVNSWTPRTETQISFLRNPTWPPLYLACLNRSLYNSSKGTQPRSGRNSNKHGAIMKKQTS